MKSVILVSFLFVSIIIPGFCSDELEKALRLLAQSTRESCGVCIETLQKKSFDLLNRIFIPGNVIHREDVIRTNDSGNMEFVVGTYPEQGKWIFDGEEILLPLITYRIHTESDNFPGIAKADYTSKLIAEAFRGSSKSHRIRGEFRIIPYSYGEGRSFVYSAKDNKIQVQVRILSILPANN